MYGPGPGFGGPHGPMWGPPPPPPHRGGCGCCCLPFLFIIGLVVLIVALV